MKLKKALFILLFFPFIMLGQVSNSVSGKIIDHYTKESLANVEVSVTKNKILIKTSSSGSFKISKLQKGENTLFFFLKGYQIVKIPVQITDSSIVNLGIIRLEKEIFEDIDKGFILLNDEDIMNAENGNSDNITGILSSSKSNFQKTVAFQFSSTFFKLRGLDSRHQNISLNGIEMNKFYNGRPIWSNWGGLNDATRNQIFTSGLSFNKMCFGGINGSLNINTFAANYTKSTKVSLASSNRNYQGRLMASYFSGIQKNGWAYAFSASYRFAKEGFFEGSVYKANSFFTSISKKLNKKHSLHITGIYAENQRGKSSPNTQEIYDLKNIKYNAYWGKQDGKIRNSRIKSVNEPLFILSHVFDINKTSTLQTNLSYQFGEITNSRLDYGGSQFVINEDNSLSIIGGGTNPDPTYYQKLPSYFLRNSQNPDYDKAYLAEQDFLKNGQLNWNNLYAANKNTGYSVYALYEDVNENKQLSINSVFNKKLKTNFNLDVSILYKKLYSENYAKMLDLLGGSGFLDVDNYSETVDEAQNDLQNPNRIINEKDKFKYNYELHANKIEGFSQLRYDSRKIAAFVSTQISNSKFQRNGLYENGRFPGDSSLGKSEPLSFLDFGIKGGFTYKFTGRHILKANTAYLTQAPTLQNSFSNSRENNDVVINLTSEKIWLSEVNYFYRSKILNAGLSVYFSDIKDATHLSFYYADGLTGINFAETTAFVQEIMTGINQQNMGAEASLTLQVTPSLQLNGVAAIGQSIYANNPNLYLTSDDFTKPLQFGKSYLKNYHISNGPQQAFSMGITYNDPKYWWLNFAVNYFNNAYINVAPILRTNNFYLDNDGIPLEDYNEEVAKNMLKQESFNPYYLINVVGGKSWKVNNYYIGFFAVVNNILNKEIKTGGFEQSRNANYKTLLEDKSREKPIFGPKYWYGYGTTFYASVYVRM